MANGFAGSGRLDERRRRRLAQDGEQSCDESLVDGVPRRRGRLDAGAVRPARRQVLLPIPALIPAQTWKLVLLAMLALLPAAVGIALTERIGEWTEAVGPGLEQLAAGAPMPLLDWYECLLLLGMGQLAALIGWVRSRSHHDYSGRYWIWPRLALVCVLFATARATGLHVVLGETVAHHLPARFWQHETLAWLVPAALVAGTMLFRLRHEMRLGQGSWPGLVLGCVAYWIAALACLDVLDAVLPHATERVVDVARFAGHGLCLLGLLLHARHVVHRTAEPAPLPERRRIPRPHFGFLFRKKTAPSDAEPETQKNQRAKPKRTRRARKPSRTSAVDEEAEATAHDDDAEASESQWDAADEESEPETPATAAQPAPARVLDRWQPAAAVPQSAALSRPQSHLEEDGEDEDDADDGLENHPSLQGLSRKQRRKMLKHLRQQQRR
jgi:hypothetical protein